MPPNISISMLLPARGRPKNLEASVDSVFARAVDPDSVEVLARLDHCDPTLNDELAILKKRGGVRVWTGPRVGYAKMHEMYNGLANLAKGQWLFLWNDDIEMRTPYWDDLIRECPPYAVQFPRRDITKTTDYTLPVVGRAFHDAVGHLSQNAFVDAWLADISGFAGTSVVRDDVVFCHHRLNDDTMNGQSDGGVEWGKFSTTEQTQLRQADRDRAVAAPGWATRHDGWVVEPVGVEVDYVKLGGTRAQAVALRGRK